RPVAALPCRAAVASGDLLPGQRGSHRAAGPDRQNGRGLAPPPSAGRLLPVCRRAAWFPPRRQHPAGARRRALFLCLRGFPYRAEFLELVRSTRASPVILRWPSEARPSKDDGPSRATCMLVATARPIILRGSLATLAHTSG